MPEQTEPQFTARPQSEWLTFYETPLEQSRRLALYALHQRDLTILDKRRLFVICNVLETTNTPTPKSRLAALSTTWLKKLRDKLYFRRK